MSTQKQRNANRANAQHSTGPASDEAKAAITCNALKHGFYANHAVLANHEDAAEYAVLQRDYFDHLAPDGPVELELAARIVLSVWQLRRIENAENQALQLALDTAKDRLSGRVKDPEALALGWHWRDENVPAQGLTGPTPLLETISRHRARWERTYYRALHELERRQRSRRGQIVPPPEVVEVHSDSPEPDPDSAPRPDRAPSRSPHRGATPPVTRSTQTPNPQIGFVPQKPCGAAASRPANHLVPSHQGSVRTIR